MEESDTSRHFLRQWIEADVAAGLTGGKVVVGISGGLDSTLCLLVAVAAFGKLGLPLDAIKVYTMPGFGTTRRTKGNAGQLCRGLGLKLETIDITATGSFGMVPFSMRPAQI